jgi:hypothetical protein
MSRYLTTLRKRAHAHVRFGFQPSIEILESRCVPAILTVNSSQDSDVRNDDLALREAIMLSNGDHRRGMADANGVNRRIRNRLTHHAAEPMRPRHVATSMAMDLTYAGRLTG